MATVTLPSIGSPIIETIRVTESPADIAAFILHVRRQMELVKRQRQKDQTFYLPPLAPENMLVCDPTRMIAAFVLFSHQEIFVQCPKTYVWTYGEFYHSVYRIDGPNSEVELLFEMHHRQKRKPSQLLCSSDLLRNVSLKILPDKRIEITPEWGDPFTK